MAVSNQSASVTEGVLNRNRPHHWLLDIGTLPQNDLILKAEEPLLEWFDIPSLAAGTPYRFCSSCRGEFTEFQKKLNTGPDNGVYGYNEEWLDMWKAWTNYQETVKRSLNSKEVIRLRYELRRG